MTLDDLRNDFRLVLYLIWRHLRLPDPTPIQLDMAHFLQHGPPRRMVSGFRGVGKSWITAAFVIWFLLKKNNANVVVVAANDRRAAKFTTFVLRLIEEVPEFEHLKPRHNQRRSASGFDVGPAPPSQTQSVTCVGIFGTFTGDRADLIVADDVEVPKNSETSSLRAKLEGRTREFSALIKPEGGQVVFLGTPQHEESIYNRLPDRGYEVRYWPILFPNEEERVRYAGRLAPFIDKQVRLNPNLVHTSTEPGRFTMIDIEARRQDYKEAGFRLQFMLDTSMSTKGDYPLRMSDLVLFPLDYSKCPEVLIHAATRERRIEDLPNVSWSTDFMYDAMVMEPIKWVPYERVIMAIDPSGSGRDETGYAILGAANGYLFLLDASGVPGHEESHCFKLLDAAKKFKVDTIFVEPNYGGGTFASLLKSHMKTHGFNCSVADSEWARGNKSKRILATLTPVFQGHRLVVRRQLIQEDYDSVAHLPEDQGHAYRLWYQVTHCSGVDKDLRHDDRLESVAIAVAEMSKVLGDRAVDAKARRDARAMDELLEDAIKAARLGPRWREIEKKRSGPRGASEPVNLVAPR